MNKSIPNKTDLIKEIISLKKKKKAVILAHYYQNSEIQELADFLGDSLYLAQCAKKVTSDIIVLAGVHFMGETAKIINPQKKVLVPDLKAGCSLSDSCPPDKFKKYIERHPGHNIVTYINCSAEIKSLSTIVCTSSNAKKVINSIPKNEKIIFAPDKNLGKYLIRETGRKMKLWDGSCVVHEAFSLEKIINLIKKYPQAKFIAHPESESPVLEIANFIGSTSELLNFVQKDLSHTYIVATESGILYEMKKKCPNKIFIPAPVDDDTCACSECSFMKMNTLEKLYFCLKNEDPEIILPNDIIDKSIIPIEKMLALG
ncbi:MAG: quinolinate synthase [Flavobacteriaceae bacterium]|nr:quinolinate synthase [Flavobacteriaceae bacterium]